MTMSVSRAKNSFCKWKIYIKKYMGNKKQSKKHWKKAGNLMIKQKYKLA